MDNTIKKGTHLRKAEIWSDEENKQSYGIFI
jgi:hypothetical protein